MKAIKAFIIVLFITITMPLMAQTNKEQQNNKENSRAKVEVVNGHNALVLKTGRKSKSSNWGVSNSADIVLKLDYNTWHLLDSLVAAPFGSSVKIKDLQGYNVEIAKANVNSNVGLMFTSGTKCVAKSEEEWKKIKQ